MSHADAVREEFARQAAAFEDPRRLHGNPEILRWIAEHAPTHPDSIVLEVAAGTGWVARGLAPLVRAVIAVDLTREMLQTGKRAVELHDDAVAGSIVFQEGDAVRLPFLDASFDLVACRLAVHHFDEPDRALEEMVRVCRPGGHLVVIDIVAPDGELGERFNEIERRRDPTHTAALTSDALRATVAQAGATVLDMHHRDNVVDAALWLEQTSRPADVAAKIIADLRAEVAGGTPTGLNARPGSGALGIKFLHRWDLVVARVP